jgi:hypothetical protein
MDLQWKPFSHVFNLSCIYFSNSAERGIYFLNSTERGLMALVILKYPWVPMDISKTPSKFHGFEWISLNFHPNLVPRRLMTEIGTNAEMEALKFQILEVNDQFFVGLNYFLLLFNLSFEPHFIPWWSFYLVFNWKQAFFGRFQLRGLLCTKFFGLFDSFLKHMVCLF